MTTAPATATLQAPAQSENANPAPEKSPAPVPVSITTVADLAKAIGANRLKPAPAPPTATQDAAPVAAPAESHPAEGSPEGDPDLSQPQVNDSAATDAPAPSDTESEDSPPGAEAETPEQRIARLEKALAKKDKRIHKLTARLHEQEDDGGDDAALSTPGEGTRPTTEPAPAPLTPTAEVADLAGRLAAMDRLQTWLANEGADGGTFKDPVYGVEIVVAAESVAQSQREAEAMRQRIAIEHGVAQREARKAWQSEQASLEQQFRSEFPALQKRDAPERVQFEHLLNNLPPQLRTAGAKLVVAKAMAWDAAQKGKPAAAAATPRTIKANSEPAPVLTRPTAAARPTTEAAAQLQAARAAYEQSGSVKDLARMRAAERALQQQ